MRAEGGEPGADGRVESLPRIGDQARASPLQVGGETPPRRHDDHLGDVGRLEERAHRIRGEGRRERRPLGEGAVGGQSGLRVGRPLDGDDDAPVQGHPLQYRAATQPFRPLCRTHNVFADPGNDADTSRVVYIVSRTFVEIEGDRGQVSRYRKHVNGKGLVAVGAEVDPSAYVHPTSYVETGARVAQNVWIGQGSWIERGALVGAGTVIGAHVHVGEDSRIGLGAKVGSHSRIGAGSTIADHAHVENDSTLASGTLVRTDGSRGYARAA
ncbi:hypothetical protein B5808_11980 [Cnuibacter physcomitrellae]|uniref:Transferase n=1 Tax=Cnuibacter physcomitrellae TaxID=1619308 RepID=A0A1X9LL07_9MICO|nr:hypothetical protein B5808_11980 [Cnuibacter physcomitrellae]